jgi:transcription-repair coupling factor (superfamily II helicase)
MTPLKGIFNIFSQSDNFIGILKSIREETGNIRIYGVSRAIKLLLLSALNITLKRPLVYIASNQYQVSQFVDEIRNLAPAFFQDLDVIFFPDYEGVDDPYTAAERLKFFSAMFEERVNSYPLIVAPVKSFLRLLPSPQEADFSTLDISPGCVLPIEKTVRKLLNMGFKKTDLVVNPGEFTQRGGIVDLFPPTLLRPVRIEWWGDEIEELRDFDPSTQRSLQAITSMNIGPAREFICNLPLLEQGVDRVKRSLKERAAQLKRAKKYDEAEFLEEKFLNKTSALLDGTDYSLLLEYPNFFFQNLIPACDCLPKNSLVCMDEPAQLKEEISSFLSGEREMDFFRSEQGLVLPRRDEIYLKWDDFIDKVTSFQTLELYISEDSFENGTGDFTMSWEAPQRFKGQIKLLLREIDNLLINRNLIVILSRYAGRISEMLTEAGVEIGLEEPEEGRVVVSREPFPEGFYLSSEKLLVLTDLEIFGKGNVTTERKRKFRKSSSAPVNLGDLNIGDIVVHEEHGIGRYHGIERLAIDGVNRDFISLIFAKEDKLYIPVDQLYKITRYIGGADNGTRLSRLGTAEWKKVRRKVAKSVQDMAEDLIKLYAIRQAVEGYIFPSDTEWQKQMEDSFIYDLTDDQRKVITDVKHDMQSKNTMDRLICGDVGYGKTEVAIRAAFKAMDTGKQVLMLVPTTVLAQQHYNTFTDRLTPYPFTVEMLSRFKSPKEQKTIVQGLKDGVVDMVIGTHRLLQKDIKLSDLGLLVIDEEQRFGVAHKEKLKQLRETVDVLTLTATPIPRTLYMSLVGARDISIIETPPEDRLPVKTYLLKRSEKIIKEAISRELARGGQIFYLHNKVETITGEASYIKSLFPQTRVTVGHGQMDEGELEQIMLDFVSGNYDILVCTTIIESGLDIPNANTLIVNHAERFGLSQLYQLRGRVGRSTKQAYAYLFYDPDRTLSDQAFKRLEAISELTDLGSGYQIAMKDLEIRGAGNLLGAEQHGFISQIGFELYCQLLSDAVAELKGEKKKSLPPPVLEIPVDSYIPDAYISHKKQQLAFYKRLSKVSAYNELSDICSEMEDRFGKLPKVVDNLVNLARIKIMAMEKKIERIKATGSQITYDFYEKPDVSKRKLRDFSEEIEGKAHFSSDTQLVITKEIRDSERLLELVEEVLVLLLE